MVGRSRRGTARLECARALGWDVLDADTQDVEGEVAELTGGLGVDLAVETAGGEQSLSLCVRCCRRGGRVVALGLSGLPTVPLPLDRAVQYDLTLAFSFSSRSSSWEAVLDAPAPSALPADALITDVVGLEDWEQGLEAIRSGRAVKVVLRP